MSDPHPSTYAERARQKRTEHPVRYFLRNGAGFLLVLLGIVGLFLPFLQGILFMVLGLGLINIPAKRKCHRLLARRFRCYRWVAIRHHRIKRRFKRARHASRMHTSGK